MLDAEEAVELRALQARAYGREGGLADAEAVRLAELSARNTPGERLTEGRPSRTRDGAEHTGASSTTRRDGDAESAIATEGRGTDEDADDAPAAAPGRAQGKRSRALMIGIALVAVFGLGAFAGWLTARPAEHVIVISGAQQGWEQELVGGGEYDAGSIRVAATEANVVIWSATKADGASTCLVFSDGEVFRPTCNATESVRSSGMDAALTVDVDDELKRQVAAQLFLTLDGRPAVVSNSFLYGEADDYGMFYDEDQVQIAENLVALGFERASLWIAGYDRDTPVWAATRTATGQTCVVYDGSGEAPLWLCDPNAAEAAGPRSLAFERPDDETGGTTRITYAYGAGPSYLEIAREPASGDAE